MPGTLAQILASKADLVDGKVKTDQIPTGTIGSSGESAYQVAVNNGFSGTEEEWLLSLKGAKGEKGDIGLQGEQGIQGIQGLSGRDGVDGLNGSNGYTPIKGVDYFDGVQGVKGDKGDQGVPGVDGQDGNDGYTPVKNIDYFDGVKGDTGGQGIQGVPGQDGSDATITKPAVEAVLTGEITSHTHPVSGGSDPWHIIKLSQDFVSSLATNANVTNFYFTPTINKTYLIFGYFLLRTATATVGARTGVAWPANVTDATMRMEASNSLTAAGIRFWGVRTTQNTGCTGFATTADSHWGSLDGIMITSGTTSGNFQITLASETAGTNVTIKAGSILMYREL